MLVDYHMHLERGEYSFDYLDQMVATGRERGIEEFGITEHSHHFREFRPCYQSVLRDDSPVGRYQDQWLKGPRMFAYGMDEWVEFLTRAKAAGYPVKLGIEVCYFPGEEERISETLASYPWDFITGSVHWLSGWGFDHPATRSEWSVRGVDAVFAAYIQALESSVASGLFDVIGHPYVVGMYGDQPTFSLEPHYQRLAKLMKDAGVCAELNTGMLYRYPARRATPPESLLRLLGQHHVPLVLGSDAHEPKDVGYGIGDAVRLAVACGHSQMIRFDRRKRIANPL